MEHFQQKHIKFLFFERVLSPKFFVDRSPSPKSCSPLGDGLSEGDGGFGAGVCGHVGCSALARAPHPLHRAPTRVSIFLRTAEQRRLSDEGE